MSPMAVRAMLLVSLAACEPRGAPPTPGVAMQPSATHDGPTARIRDRPAVRSCPATGKPLAVQLDPRIVLGEAASVTWIFGYAAGEAVLAHLGVAGKLALTRVPLHNVQVGAVAGEHIWLYASRESDTVPTRWISVDVSDPDAPVIGPVVPVKVGARTDGVEMLAVDTRRALVIVGSPADRELVLLDPVTSAAIAAPQPLGTGFEPVHAICADDRCAVVGISDEGGGPDRRLVVVRVLAAGTLERELLAPGWIGQPHVAERGDQMIVTWTDDSGLWLRALDLWGRPAGPAVAVSWPVDRPIRNDTLLDADGAVMLAVGERGRWSVAPIGRGAVPGAFRELPGADGHLLAGAPLDDGLAWVSLGGDVRYDEIGAGVMMHFWQSQAVGGFLPAAAGEALRIDLAAGSGDGRGGFEAYVLSRPGAAAALVVPRGDADHSHEPVFAPLRAPCPA